MTFMSTLSKLATTVGGALGGPIVPAVLEIGKDLLKLMDDAKEVVSSTDVPKLEAMREELEPKVMAHADATENKLRGN